MSTTPRQAAQAARTAGAFTYSYRPAESAPSAPRPTPRDPHPFLPPAQTAKELLEEFGAAKRRGDLARLHEVCAELERGWSRPPVWRSGRNTLASQRNRLSPCVRYVGGGPEQEYYQAFLQAVLDPEYRRLAGRGLS